MLHVRNVTQIHYLPTCIEFTNFVFLASAEVAICCQGIVLDARSVGVAFC
jgi:hypothetical protein